VDKIRKRAGNTRIRSWRKRSMETKKRDQQRAVQQKVVSLVKDLSWHEACWLASSKEKTSELMYQLVGDAKGIKAKFVASDEIPWHVLLLFGIKSRKHRFRPKSSIKAATIHTAWRHFRSRVFWWSHFASNKKSMPFDSRGEEVFRFKPLVKRPPRQFQGLVMPEVRSYVDAIHNVLIKHLRKTNSRIAHSRRSCSNIPLFARMSLAWLRSNNLTISVSDKDGVFVMASADMLRSLIDDKLKLPQYREISKAQFDAEVALMLKIGHKLCDRLAKHGFRSESFDCKECMRNGRNTFALGWTIKTHKFPAQLRLIHSSSGYALKGLSSFIDRLVANICSRCSHIVKNTNEVLKKIKTRKFSNNVTLVKADIKEFYMSGTHSFLASSVCKMVDGPLKELVGDVIYFLLYYQFLEDQGSGKLFQVEVGSGMGAPHSGSVSDLAFMVLAESNIQNCGVPDQGIDLYARFRDDILIIAKNPPCARRFVRGLEQAASSQYCIEVETVSMQGLPMLDTWIYRPETYDGSLAWKPYIKPTARHVPLGSDSNHHMGIHRSWPITELQRMHKLSCDPRTSRGYRQEKLARFKHHFMPPSIIQLCESWDPHAGTLQPSGCRQDMVRTIRVIVPFHPVLASGLQQELTTVHRHFDSTLRRAHFGEGFTPRVAFAAGGRQLNVVAKTLRM